MDETRISHYRLGRLLGRGGMGEVYEAEDLDLGRRVALKFIAPALAADPENLKRFEREARSAAALNHPNIATLYAFDRDQERRFIAMELVAGESLRARIRRGRLPIPDALAIARDVAGALATAHRRGIVHRDIKPENLMFDEDGRVKVMDFGLARAALASQLTMTGTTMGTAGYMAPESLRGAAGPPADVFALGVVLHEMLAGDLPFAGDTPLSLMYTIANEPPKRARSARPEVPEALDQLVARLLEKDAAIRPDAAGAARELAALAGTPPPIGTEWSASSGTSPPADAEAATAAMPTLPGALVRGAATEELTAERVGVADAAQGEALARREQSLEKRRIGRLRWIWVIAINVVIWAGLMVFLSARSREDRGRRLEDAVRFNNLAQRALMADSLDRARALLAGALGRSPDYALARINLGQYYRRAGQPDSAAVTFREVIAKSAHEPASLALAWYGLANLDIESGALDGAVADLTHSLAADSTRAEYYNDLGWALATSGDATRARAVLELGLRRFPERSALSKNLAFALTRQGELPAATHLLDGVTNRDPAYASAWGLSAMVHARMNDASGGRKAWQAYVALAPDSAERDSFARGMGALQGDVTRR